MANSRSGIRWNQHAGLAPRRRRPRLCAEIAQDILSRLRYSQTRAHLSAAARIHAKPAMPVAARLRPFPGSAPSPQARHCCCCRPLQPVNPGPPHHPSPVAQRRCPWTEGERMTSLHPKCKWKTMPPTTPPAKTRPAAPSTAPLTVAPRLPIFAASRACAPHVRPRNAPGRHSRRPCPQRLQLVCWRPAASAALPVAPPPDERLAAPPSRAGTRRRCRNGRSRRARPRWRRRTWRRASCPRQLSHPRLAAA
mmetsp:Transcript_9085/g.26105  ORF Transcript_9085/g.26105 Transcript_9085/m.26105 type:complete len:251 (+) Transcript_9085:2720-3472(+)